VKVPNTGGERKGSEKHVVRTCAGTTSTQRARNGAAVNARNRTEHHFDASILPKVRAAISQFRAG